MEPGLGRDLSLLVSECCCVTDIWNGGLFPGPMNTQFPIIQENYLYTLMHMTKRIHYYLTGT